MRRQFTIQLEHGPHSHWCKGCSTWRRCPSHDCTLTTRGDFRFGRAFGACDQCTDDGRAMLTTTNKIQITRTPTPPNEACFEVEVIEWKD